MKYGKRIFVAIFAFLLLSSVLVFDTQAQRRGGTVVVRRPVVVGPIVRRPFWGFRPYWRYRGFYDPYYYSPYQRYAEQKYYLESELRGNERELAEHEEKYRADGVITAKERRELDDDIKDVRNSRSNLDRFMRNN